MIVSMWMARNLVTISATTTISRAAATMTEKKIRRLPVVDTSLQGDRLLGLITASDLYRAYPPNMNPFAATAQDVPGSTLKVADIMTRAPTTTTPEAPIEEAARIMRDTKVGALPVLRGELLVGIITESDIFRAFVSIFSLSRGGARVTFEATEGEDLFKFVGGLVAARKSRVVSLITTQQDGKPVCVMHVNGGAIDGLLDDLWKSRHKVLNVLRH